MTLGPDRRTILRWLSEPYYQTADPAGGGGSGTEKTDAGKDDAKPDGDKDGDKSKADADDKSGKPKAEAITIEHDGKRYVLQEHVDTIAARARTEGKTAGRTEVEEEARRKALEESGNFKELYEKEVEKREAAERELKAAKLSELKQKVGTKHGLSQRLIDRLVGDDEAALEADAKELAKELGTSAKTKDEERKPAPKTEGGSGSKVRSGVTDAEDEKPKRPAKTFRFQTPNDVSWNNR